MLECLAEIRDDEACQGMTSWLWLPWQARLPGDVNNPCSNFI
jgi:hypothetical protein